MPTTQPDPNSDESAPAFDPFSIYHAIRERLWLILGSLLLTCGLGALYIAKTPKSYEATTVIQVEQAARKIVDIQDVATDDLKATEQLKTIEQNLGSPTLFQGVIERLKLTPEQLGITSKKEVNTQELIRALRDATSVKLQRGTRLINVTVENRDPALAQKLSGEVVQQFVRDYLEQRVDIADYAGKFLREERDRLQARVVESEAAVQAYRDEHPDVSLGDSDTLTDNRMLALSSTLNDARTKRFKLEADYAQIQKLGTKVPEDLLLISSVAEAPAVLSMQKDLAAAQSEFAALKERYKPLHPKYMQAERQLKELNSVVQSTISKAAESVGSSLQSAVQSEQKAEDVLRKEEAAKVALSRSILPYQSLQKNLESDRELFNNVQRRLKETEVTKSMEQENIRIVGPAFLPDKPSRPKVVLVALGSIALGLLIGGVLTLLLSAANQTFKTIDQVEQELGVPAIGAIPKASSANLKNKAQLTVQDPNGAIAEGFRSMRASLTLLDKDRANRSVLFSSSVPGEGKSFCSSHYAVSLAQLGQRTLIIDGDLRLPTVHKQFFDEPPEFGVSSVMLGERSLETAVTPSGVENLDVLPAGKRAAKPAELIATGAFKRLIEEALSKYERVVVDSAPVHAVSDSLLMIEEVDAVCLVIHSGKTPRRVVSRALHKINEAGGTVSGVVLNRVEAAGLGYYYHYSAGEYGDKVYGAPQSTADR